MSGENQGGRPLLEIHGLDFSFRHHPVLSGVELTVHRGESILLLGQNGAGKTTLLACMLGLLPQTAGRITWSPRRFRWGGFISEPTVLAEKTGLFQIEYEAELRRRAATHRWNEHRWTSEIEIQHEIRHYAALLNFDETLLRQRTATYSTGMLKKLALLKALVFRPDLLILDEPASGLDPRGIRDLRDCLLRIREETDITLIQSSHQINEARRVASRALILSGGRIKRSLPLSTDSHRWRLRSEAPFSRDDIRLLEAMAAVTAVTDGAAEITLKDGLSPSELLKKLVIAGVAVREFSRCSEDLEDAYLEAIEDDET